MAEPNELSASGKQMGKVGGKARAAALTPERRREIARMGGKALARKRRLQETLVRRSSAKPHPIVRVMPANIGCTIPRFIGLD